MSDKRGHNPPSAASADETATKARRRRRWWYLLFLAQLGAIVWPPFYNKAEPAFAGIPFFYWYQFVWIPVTSLLIWLVYRSRSSDETR